MDTKHLQDEIWLHLSDASGELRIKEIRFPGCIATSDLGRNLRAALRGRPLQEIRVDELQALFPERHEAFRQALVDLVREYQETFCHAGI